MYLTRHQQRKALYAGVRRYAAPVSDAVSFARTTETDTNGGQRTHVARSPVVYFDVTIRDKADRHADRQILSVDLVLFAESGSGVS